MSSAVKTVASIALPIVGNFIAPGIGGVIGGAIGGALNGGVKGAILGGVGGGLAGSSSIFADGGLIGNAGSNALTSLGDSISGGVGSAFGSIGDALSSGVSSVGQALGFGGDAASAGTGAASTGGAGIDSLSSAGGYSPTAVAGDALNSPAINLGGSSLGGTSTDGLFTAGNVAPSSIATGGAGVGSVAPTVATGGAGTGTSIASRLLSPVSALTGITNTVMAQQQADAAKKASEQQTAAIQQATQNYAPYSAAGTAAANQLQTIEADPSSYIQNNPMYTSLADDAQRRLEASQASKGKVNSGGTQAALQDQLLQIGNGLVQQQEGTLQGTVNSGLGAASGTANLQTAGGVAQSAGTIGQGNAYQTGYNNQIQTLLALQGLNKTPTYQPATAGSF